MLFNFFKFGVICEYIIGFLFGVGIGFWCDVECLQFYVI